MQKDLHNSCFIYCLKHFYLTNLILLTHSLIDTCSELYIQQMYFNGYEVWRIIKYFFFSDSCLNMTFRLKSSPPIAAQLEPKFHVGPGVTHTTHRYQFNKRNGWRKSYDSNVCASDLVCRCGISMSFKCRNLNLIEDEPVGCSQEKWQCSSWARDIL